jgi:CheY-like chemotaxis protein
MKQNSEKLYCILLAEDDLDDQKIASDAFAKAIPNAQLFIVNSGVEALEYLHNSASHPDVFITDIMMPQLTGLEVLTQVKKQPEFRELPVVILSTSRESGDIAKSLALGAALYISKPLIFRDWVSAMQQIGLLLPA